MIIHGLGIDIIEVKRFSKFRNSKTAFFKKIFTKNELDYCFLFTDPAPHLAGIFAAKEAVVKACGGKISILEVEIRHRTNGQPKVYTEHKSTKDILISISHTKSLACAIAANY